MQFVVLPNGVTISTGQYNRRRMTEAALTMYNKQALPSMLSQLDPEPSFVRHTGSGSVLQGDIDLVSLC